MIALIALLAAATVHFFMTREREVPEVGYPWHTDIVATTFWVGEVFDPEAEDGTQEYSTYDSQWLTSYGGCDGVLLVSADAGAEPSCETERRTADNDFFPTSMEPLENPFYLDLPFDDVNNEAAFAMRGDVIPWAAEPAYAAIVDDPRQSLMKNRWVVLHREGRFCYGQIQDAGPGEYADAAYVFGEDDARPANTRYNGAGMDVSPALNGCLAFTGENRQDDRVDWAFIDEAEVPDGPWRRIVTTSPVR